MRTETTETVAPGDELPNGATVLAFTPGRSDDVANSTVLAVSGTRAEYVTWRCFRDGSGTWAGHYFPNSLTDAVQDYIDRGGEDDPRKGGMA